jgi:trans-aconitate methyltransferase
MNKKWQRYYKVTSARKVHPILELALEYVDSPGVAYDMGAGAGVEVKYLLERDWKVHALDNEESSLKFIKKSIGNSKTLKLDFVSFHSLKMEKCKLIFGSASFPFCHPKHFDKFWNRMRKSLKEDGVIAGTLFGYKDDWSATPSMIFQNENTIINLFKYYDILFFDELKEDKDTTFGTMKHWHVYSFILRKL